VIPHWSYLLSFALYGLFAIPVLSRWRSGGESLDAPLTDGARRLVGVTAFYVLTPAAIVAHQLVHALVARALGATITEARLFVLFGWTSVGREPPLDAVERLLLAGSGLVFTQALAYGALASVLLMPGSARSNLLRLSFARQQLALVLVVWPLIALLTGRLAHGELRAALAALGPQYGAVAAGLWSALAAATWLALLGGPVRRALARRTSAFWDVERSAMSRLRAGVDTPGALLDLARAALTRGDASTAEALLARARALAPDEAHVPYLRGMIALRAGAASAASALLREAGLLLEEGRATTPVAERAELRVEAALGLAAARLRLGDPQGALETALAVRAEAPMDARPEVLAADALLATGAHAEARAHLERALALADDVLRPAIRRRLGALSGR
jgi:tetratricopeptide (TPR) repeat protein